MKTILSSVAVFAIVCSLAPASFAEPQTGKDSKPTETASDPNKVVCKRIEVKPKMPSAVIRKERICHTQAEWDAALKVNEEMLKKYNDAFKQGSPPN